jgi:4-amino-4-deoxy-L-arabinose transferase-like glycosyltransferase
MLIFAGATKTVYSGKDLKLPRGLILIAILVCFGATLRVVNLRNVESRTPDERVYTWQAKTWLESGQAGIKSMVEEYKADAETRFYPPPTRVGMIRLVAAMMRWTGRDDDGVGALISCAASIGSLLVLALIGVRFLPIPAAAAGLLLYCVLPAELAVSRRTWTDALVELTGLLLIWFACEITRDSRRRIWLPLFALVGSAGILVKESMPVPVALCALWILLILFRRHEWDRMLILVLTTLAGAAVSLWWLSHQVGSLADYVGIVTGIPKANAENPYALEYASGPPYFLLRAFWIVAPLTSLLSVAGLVAVWHKRSLVLTWLALFEVIYVAIAMAMPHWLNLRYVGNTFGSFCLLAGLGFWSMFFAGYSRLKVWEGRLHAGLAIAMLLGGAWFDYARFQRVFVRDQTADLSIKMLIDEQGQW